MMQIWERWSTLLVALVAMLLPHSCKDAKKEATTPQQHQQLQIIAGGEDGTLRAEGTQWQKGDAIGVMVTPSGSSTPVSGYAHLEYTTPSGDGIFAPASSNPEGVKLTATKYDLIAYYPYNPQLQGGKLPLNVKEQGQPQRLDLLYANNAHNLSSANPVARPHFERQLSRLNIKVEGQGSIASLEGLEVELRGVVTEGSFDITSGALALGTAKEPVLMYHHQTAGNVAHRSAIVLPNQSLKGAEVLFKLGGKSYTWQVAEELLLQPSYAYHYKVVLAQDAQGKVTLTIAGITATEWEKGGSNTGGSTPTPPPAPPTPPTTERAWYMEMPLFASGTAPQNTLEVTLHIADDHWFAGGSTPGGKRRNYSLLFSTEHTQPLWVAYPLYPDCMGGAGRNENWEWDPKIARKYQPDLHSSYKGNPKQSRGHMLRSNHRTASAPLNETTFYFTNMIPQVQRLNGGAWLGFEDKEQAWARNTSLMDTLYAVCGPILPKENLKTVMAGGRAVTIPTHSWKVVLYKNKRTGEWHSIGVRMPNEDSDRVRSGNQWTDFVVSVKELEEELGLTFFTHLDPAIADRVKSNKSTAHFR